ncbi:MAG: hypothetical protein ACO3CU_06065, partial [Candidatus Nanopelagicales bacterium]
DVLYDPTILADVIALERGFAIDPRTDPGDEEMMIGVQDGVADPARSVLIGAEPSRSLPIVRPDGTPITPEADE